MKLIQITLILLVAVSVFLYINEGRIYHIARTLPFNSRGPVEWNYELSGLIVLVLFLWGWHRLKNHEQDDD